MAAFRALGPNGPFWVPFVMAVLTLVVAYRLGRADDESDTVTGMFAASLVAVSPTFFNGAIQPMSDVSATFWILAATRLSVGGPPRPIGTGLTAGMAVLTRPVLLPAALVIMGLLGWQCVRVGLVQSKRGTQPGPSAAVSTAAARPNPARLAAGVLVFAVLLLVQAGLNIVFYGSPVGSGYGSSADLLDPARVLENLVSYASWITRSHTVVFWIAWGAGLVVLRGRRWPGMFSLVAAAAIAPYLFYFTFDDWESTRFVLPGVALALIVAAAGVDVTLARHARRWRPLLLLAGVLVCATASHQFLARRFVFDLWRGESKYPRVGQWVRERTPPGAVIVSSLHSGSIHYYSGRDTVRWDMIPARMLAPSVGSLSSHGHAVYLALDRPSEAAPFETRFRDDLAAVSMVPLDRIGDVLIYELTCRISDPRCQLPK
jgi:hypothetical protein